MKYNNTPVGIIPETWEIKKISEITEIVTDYVANGSFASLAENVMYKDTEDIAVLIRLVDFNNNFNGDFVFIDEHAYEFLKKSKLYGGEIIISNVGANVGTVFKCPKLKYKMSLAPNSIMVKFHGCNEFYYQWLRGYNGQQMLKSIVTGSAQPKFNKTNFKEMFVPVPPIEIQKQIASILSVLDDKIELNNKINENLESQAQAIFKSWFVDFEPFGGVMPEDWRTGSLSEICGYSKDKVNIEDLTLDTYYSTENMQPNRQGAVQATTLPTIKQTTACKKGNVLISNIRPYFKKIIYCFADCGCSTDVLCFVPNKSEYSAFLYCALYSDKFFDYMVAGSKGTKMPRGDKQQIMMYPICIPSTEYVEQFSKIVAPMFETVYTNRLEANDLAILRDTLLPKLMNGEIDVSKVKI